MTDKSVEEIEPTTNEMEEYLLKQKSLQSIKLYNDGTAFFDKHHDDKAYEQGYRSEELAINQDTGDITICQRCKHVVFNEKHGKCICHHCTEFKTQGCERCNFTMDEYPYYCAVCDENIYKIETETVCLQIP